MLYFTLLGLFISSAFCIPHNMDFDKYSSKTDSARAYPGSTLKKKHFVWKAPGEDDLRSPCPFMNTLANHDFVPHDGRNVTRTPFVASIQEALGLDEPFATQIFDRALVANPTPNATFFDLDMLHKTHGVIEHDGSLSRRDAIFDPTNPFDEGTFDNFVSYFGTNKTINTRNLANARARHAYDMSLVNSNFTITEPEIPVIVGENAMLISIFGNPDTAVVKRSFIEFFFRKERFPVLLGWSPSDGKVGPNVGNVVQAIIDQSPADVPLTFSPKKA
ncbi:heme-thiolate peroxidase [Fusarium decemcellulare]|uniref:Heme-thiolate peroxidase n=1 Tax=Fusarium decemcellulare TaxID=57161 RepID=A0ACC1SKQ8_9HYPO|nr:heme-thiolate peroxidase [Fusarium decemcellulare]